MRYNTPIFFQRKEPGAFDPATHNYGEDQITEEMRYADITETDTATLQMVYGTIKQQSLTVRLQRPYTAPFDVIRIGSKNYAVSFSRKSKVFVLAGVQ